MAESLERCFSRALIKHFPSEDGDTDEEFHINTEDKERKDKKRNRSSKHCGPESLIKATEQVQRKRSFQGGKGSTPSEEENKSVRPPPPPHWTNGPPHTHSLPPNHQHMHEGNIRGMYHPGQQVPTGLLRSFFHVSLHFIISWNDPSYFKGSIYDIKTITKETHKHFVCEDIV